MQKSFILFMALCFCSAMYGTSITVTTTDDEDDGFAGGGTGISVREAIKYASAGDTVFIPKDVDYALIMGQIVIPVDMTIIGTGDFPPRLSGNHTSRIFWIDGKTVKIHHVLFTRGRVTGGADGGCIRIGGASADVTLDCVGFSFSDAQDGGGALHVRDGKCTMIQTRIGTSTAAYGGGLQVRNAEVEMDGCTVDLNDAFEAGGGIYVHSTGASTSLSMTNCSVLFNDVTGTTKDGGGIYCRSTNCTINMTNVTVAQNTATDQGGGVRFQHATINMLNTLIGGNTATNAGDNFFISGPITIGTNTTNHVQGGCEDNDGTCTGSSISFSYVTDPNFTSFVGPQGGKTVIQPFMSPSEAIDNGTAAGAPATDQRGFIRNGNTDIGAYEYNGCPPEVTNFICPEGVLRFDTDPGMCNWTVPDDQLDPFELFGDTWMAVNDFDGMSTLQGATFPKGRTTVTWTMTDHCVGNTGTCTFDVRVRDREAPVFDNCPDDFNITVPFCTPGAVQIWPSLTASDNCNGPNRITISVFPLSGSTFPVGTTPVNATATDRAGNVGNCDFDVIVTEVCDPLPAGLALIDIGNTGGVVGKTCYDAATKTYEIKTSGSGIPNAIPSSDGFHYVVTPTSDMVVDVKARIVQHPSNNNRDRVGVMIRKSDPANSASVSTLIAGDNRTYMVNRPTDGMFASSIAGPILPGPLWPGPVYWVRLHKIGTVYYGYVSPDGVSWTLISVQTAAITGSFGVGIAATASTPGSTVHYTVDNLTINGTAYKTGEEGLDPLLVTAFPNPTHDRLNVQLAAPAFSNVELTLSNAMGQRLLIERFEADASGIISRRLEMGDLAAGMYMLEVRTAMQSQVVKVIKR